MALGTGHRAAARARVRVRRRRRCRRGAATTSMSCCCCCCRRRRLAQTSRRRCGSSCASSSRSRERNPLHVRLPAADERLPDGAELPRPRRPAREARQVRGRPGDEPRPGARRVRRATMAPRRFSPARSTRASIGSRGSSRISSASPGAAPPSCIARRWSRPPAERPAPRRHKIDALRTRLDDELRDLD